MRDRILQKKLTTTVMIFHWNLVQSLSSYKLIVFLCYFIIFVWNSVLELVALEIDFNCFLVNTCEMRSNIIFFLYYKNNDQLDKFLQ